MNRLIVYLIIFVVVVFVGLQSYSPCDTPIRYKIGSLDTRFNLSTQQFLVDIAQAGNIWSSSEDKNLFQYDPQNGNLIISLVFDSRQALTDQISGLDNQLQNEKNSISPQLRQYNNLALDFQQKKVALNSQIRAWNNKGGAPPDVYDQLISQQSALQKEADQLNQMAQELNRSTDVYNTQVTQLNQTTNTFNSVLQIKPEEGLYSSKDNTITVYFSNNRTELVHTLAHEMGHALGFVHVPGNNSIMYFQSNDSLTPSTEDIAQLGSVCARRTFFGEAVTRLRIILNSINLQPAS